MKRNNISVNQRTSVVKKTVIRESQITRMNRMAQMGRNSISVEPKVRNLCASVPSVFKKSDLISGSLEEEELRIGAVISVYRESTQSWGLGKKMINRYILPYLC